MTLSRTSACVFLTLFVWSAGCSTLLGADFDRLPAGAVDGSAASDPETSGKSETGTEAGSDVTQAPECPGTAEPTGVRVHAEAGTWCVDSSEVTRAQYAVFVASADLPQPSFCAWNNSYVPNDHWTDSPHDGRPVTRVDWCDAYMYCAWAGKRLCGEHAEKTICSSEPEGGNVVLTCPADQVIVNIAFASFGTATGSCGAYETGSCDAKNSWAVATSDCMEKPSCTIPATTSHFGDPCDQVVKHLTVQVICGKRTGGGDAHNQWGAVCTEDDAHLFSYGTTYDPNRCNGADMGSGAIKPAKSMAKCETAKPGIFDMSGNAYEWVDGCSVDANNPGAQHDTCCFRGGSYNSQGDEMRCGTTYISTRDSAWDDVGFRCCSRE